MPAERLRDTVCSDEAGSTASNLGLPVEPMYRALRSLGVAVSVPGIEVSRRDRLRNTTTRLERRLRKSSQNNFPASGMCGF